MSRLFVAKRKRLSVAAALAVALGLSVGVSLATGGGSDTEGLRETIPGEPGRLGPDEVLADGVVESQRWSLVAWPSDAGYCFDLEWKDQKIGGCGFGVPGEHAIGWGQGSIDGFTWIFGPVEKSVRQLDVTLDNGRTLAADVTTVSSAPWNVYVVPADDAKAKTVTGIDTLGQIVAQIDLGRSAP